MKREKDAENCAEMNIAASEPRIELNGKRESFDPEQLSPEANVKTEIKVEIDGNASPPPPQLLGPGAEIKGKFIVNIRLDLAMLQSVSFHVILITWTDTDSKLESNIAKLFINLKLYDSNQVVNNKL